MALMGPYWERGELGKEPSRQFHYGAAVFANGERHACSIADFSGNGARISIDTPHEMPQRFILLLTATGSVRRVCRVVWRSDKEVGVSFIFDEGDDQAGRIYLD